MAGPFWIADTLRAPADASRSCATARGGRARIRSLCRVAESDLVYMTASKSAAAQMTDDFSAE
jgi:hypothetical protein